MELDIFHSLQTKRQEEEVALIVSCNEKTEQFGLTLGKEEAEELTVCRNNSLKRFQRIEFGRGMLDKLIYEFCDSQYITQDNYLETLKRLEDIFYRFKNEVQDKVTDDELLTFMREQFEEVCYGDLEYLETTCLVRFAGAARAGYDGYKGSGGSGEYSELKEEQGWDSELYQTVMRETFWE